MSGSSISSTRTPQITPVMSFRDGFNAGASAKNRLEVRALLQLRAEFAPAVSGQPAQDLVNLFLRPAFLLGLADVVGIDARDARPVDPMPCHAGLIPRAVPRSRIRHLPPSVSDCPWRQRERLSTNWAHSATGPDGRCSRSFVGDRGGRGRESPPSHQATMRSRPAPLAACVDAGRRVRPARPGRRSSPWWRRRCRPSARYRARSGPQSSSRIAVRRRSQALAAALASVCGISSTNSSPPVRTTRSSPPVAPSSSVATHIGASSPAWWPKLVLARQIAAVMQAG